MQSIEVLFFVRIQYFEQKFITSLNYFFYLKD